MTRWEIAVLWAVCYFGALVAFAARITYLLGADPVPPADPALLSGWERRRRWLLISEFSALPMFSTLAVLANVHGWLSPVLAVLFATITGALGFAFFLHALEWALNRKYGIPRRPQP